MLLMLLILPAGVFATPTTQQGNFKVSVAGTDTWSIPRQLDLKATQIPNGKLSEVTGFVIDPKDVIQVKQGENLTVSTSQDLKIHKIKVKNTQGELIELLPLSNSLWSLQGLTTGVYLLDVIVPMSSSGLLGAYETILVILEPGKQPLFPQQYITQMNTVIKTDAKIVFKDPPPKRSLSPCYFDPSLDECKTVNGICPEGLRFTDSDQCVPIGKCPDGYARLDDDESGKCYNNSEIKVCPDGYITHEDAACVQGLYQGFHH